MNSPEPCIFIVDDSKTTRLLVQAYLVGSNFKFVEASSALDALGIIAQIRPSLVLSDVFMPDLDGFSFVRALRCHSDPVVREVPVILASSKRDPDIARKSIEAGANLFMNKPLAGETLATNLRKLLSSGQSVSRRERK